MVFHLKELREERNLTTYRLSKLSGVAQSYIYRIENQDANPTISVIEKLALALDVDLDELVQIGNNRSLKI